MEALTHLPESWPARPQVLDSFRRLMNGMRRYQAPDGSWHQVMDEPGTYREFTVTAMTVAAMARGLRLGMARPQLRRGGQRGWRAVQARVSETGELVDVCTGTGAGQNATREYYLNRPALFGPDDRGGAMALTAALEMHALVDRQVGDPMRHVLILARPGVAAACGAQAPAAAAASRRPRRPRPRPRSLQALLDAEMPKIPARAGIWVKHLTTGEEAQVDAATTLQQRQRDQDSRGRAGARDGGRRHAGAGRAHHPARRRRARRLGHLPLPRRRAAADAARRPPADDHHERQHRHRPGDRAGRRRGQRERAGWPRPATPTA